MGVPTPRHDMEILDQSYEGIFVIKLSHKITDYVMIIYSVYLPPEESDYGRNSVDFYAHLITNLYLYNDCDSLYICGDTNGRTGNLSDFVQDVDLIPPRSNVDKNINSHGKALNDFLLESKCCILNGRITPHLNDFTYLPGQGNSVVDYIICNQEALESCTECKAITMNDCIGSNNLESMITRQAIVPDHSLVLAKILYSYSEAFHSDIYPSQNPPQHNPHNPNKKI